MFGHNGFELQITRCKRRIVAPCVYMHRNHRNGNGKCDCLRKPSKKTQEGGTTILVVLTLLVLLSVLAMGMSKNSLKEIQTTAFLRQGTMARNVADSGIEWSIYWIDLGGSSDEAASNFIALKHALVQDNARSGQSWNLKGNLYRPGGPASTYGQVLPPPSSNPSFQVGLEPDFELGFTIGLTRMGKLPVAGMSQGGRYTPAAGGAMLQAPDLWAIRSDAQVRPKGSGLTFIHAREAWVSTPVR